MGKIKAKIISGIKLQAKAALTVLFTVVSNLGRRLVMDIGNSTNSTVCRF